MDVSVHGTGPTPGHARPAAAHGDPVRHRPAWGQGARRPTPGVTLSVAGRPVLQAPGRPSRGRTRPVGATLSEAGRPVLQAPGRPGSKRRGRPPIVVQAGAVKGGQRGAEKEEVKKKRRGEEKGKAGAGRAPA
jgi:hypothetical protein